MGPLQRIDHFVNVFLPLSCLVSCMLVSAKTEKCPGISLVRAPQATRCVMVCHGHDPCHLLGGQEHGDLRLALSRCP